MTSDADADGTQQLHHLVAEGSDLPTSLMKRPSAGGEAMSVSARQERITLGRGRSCDVVLDDERVSRLHAIVRIDAGNAAIEDAGSTNGTYVDGVRVEGITPLREGAMIRFGRRGPVFRYGKQLGRGSSYDAQDPQQPPEFGRL